MEKMPCSRNGEHDEAQDRFFDRLSGELSEGLSCLGKPKKKANFYIVKVLASGEDDEDLGSNVVCGQIKAAGHLVAGYRAIKDDARIIADIAAELADDTRIDAIIFSGGTGISSSDTTIETIRPMFSKELTAFNPIFINLCYKELGSSCLLSRATAGIMGKKVVYLIPSSPRACKLAAEQIILPEIDRILNLIRK